MTIVDRKERELKRREEEILAAALSLFDRDDWQTVTIDQIAAKAEIGKGTVYTHFESKDQIYARLAIRFFRGLLEKVRTVDPRGPVLDYLGRTMTLFWEYHQEIPEYRRVIRYCRRSDFRKLVGESLRLEMESLDAEFLAVIAPVISRGTAEGVLLDKPVESLLMGIHAAMIGLLEMEGIECMQTPGSPMSKEAMFAEVKAFALRGVAR